MSVSTSPHLHERDLPDSEQYTIWQILGIWLSITVPMGVNLWWVMPNVILGNTSVPGIVYLLTATAGLVWQAVVALIILKREVRPFTWAGLKRRLWLDKPQSPRTGRASWRLLWWAVLLAVGYLALAMTEVLEPLNKALTNAIPALSPPDYALIENLAIPEVEGAWWLMAVLLVLILCNYLIGEELIFRGILLPKMRGVFGKWDVLANGVLFATYHVHLIWAVPAMLVTDWVYAWITKRYRSYWMAVVFHGLDAIFLLVLFPLAILGML